MVRRRIVDAEFEVRAERRRSWGIAVFFLALSAWLIPGSIWGTDEFSPYAGGQIYWITIPVAIAAIATLTTAIRKQRRKSRKT